MSELTLVVVDTSGIQSYIFGSNRLRENVGASHLVHLATQGWLQDSVDPSPLLGTKAHNIRDYQIASELHLQQGLDVELVYAGGGNTVLLFRSDELAKRFTYNLSRKLIEEAPGLEVVAVRQPVDWANGSLAEKMGKAFQNLQRRKAERERSQPLLGLGVTAACQSTGLVANFEEDEPGEGSNNRQVLLSSAIKAKWDQNNPAKDRLMTTLRSTVPADFTFPDDFDELGRDKGDFSYIAVVHADGNGMGKIFEKIIDRYEFLVGEVANRGLIKELRDFSNAVNTAGVNALRSVVGQVVEWNQRSLLYPYTAKDGTKFLSIRPIVFGGDDVTFVCDGRIGLKTAQLYLGAFRQERIPDGEGGTALGNAAAGVAIVKVHYPFARAYDLSEALCKNAKTVFGRDVSTLDWHLAQSGLWGSLNEIRRREYDERRNDNGKVASSLLMRPVTMGEHPNSGWHTWDQFTTLLSTFKNTAQWPRNKVMQLREALRQGEAGKAAVQSFVDNYSLDGLPKIIENEPQHRGQDLT